MDCNADYSISSVKRQPPSNQAPYRRRRSRKECSHCSAHFQSVSFLRLDLHLMYPKRTICEWKKLIWTWTRFVAGTVSGNRRRGAIGRGHVNAHIGCIILSKLCYPAQCFHRVIICLATVFSVFYIHSAYRFLALNSQHFNILLVRSYVPLHCQSYSRYLYTWE